MPQRWTRAEVELGMVLTEDDLSSDDPLLYKVVAIVDEPTVVIAPLYDRDGDEREHYVISSLDFAKFRQVLVAGEPGRVQSLQYGDRP